MPNKDNPEEVKPVTPVVETPVVETPEFKNEDLKKPFEEIASNKELPVEEKKEEKPEEKPEEKEEEIVIDPNKIAEDVAAKVTENLKPAEVEEKKEEVKDAYQEFFDKVKAEKGREPNWAEVSKFIQEQTLASIKEERVQEQKAEDERKATETKATEELTKRFNATLDEEIQELYDKGELTPIKDKNNPNDQGVIERKSLFQKMLDVNIERANFRSEEYPNGKPPIMSIMRIKLGYWTKPEAQPAGEEAPISMGKGSPAGEGEESELDYSKDVHKPWPNFHIPQFGKK